MKFRLTATFLLTFFTFTTLLAQYNTNQNKVWMFGLGAGLDFNSGSPVSQTGMEPSMAHLAN